MGLKNKERTLFVRLQSIVNKFEGLFGYENKHIEKHIIILNSE